MKYIPLLIVVSLTACTDKKDETPSDFEEALQMTDVRSVIADMKGWTTTFVSRGGQMAGMDSDSQIVFYDDGRVSMTEYGVGPVTYNGKYTVNEDREITLHLENYPSEWPRMVIRKHAGDILLFRSDGAAGLEFGGRGGATETPGMKSFWPFGLSSLSWPEPEMFEVESGPDSKFEPLLPPRE